ncbi:MAG: hypothetical protein KZQ64_07465 [gamma proteobacterium symbiont of Bathyaustriella thionipta]|nr:hypothetical protein [gamma proteobacterium symbiont of Bathyaustriella thionipta]MCU7948901.1 hypothetical protein [gamma proteobacterium symbiont of Bathyaustriella thionipta]MCU7953209.1 hypothetical protein [gamma proteobacterium symbiont of Bathyaustriella thionipta]MCU7955475.1 hypothetical protein [gamma proteobacterium symbiont of Bathyaustriella thionipta]MCU7965682.1 hypothetical protein [gamma proteobacterium symbiont of Bathyaustriella thionipta]
MLKLTETAIRLYRQLFGSPELAGQLADGIDTVLDGNTAIAVTEACITEVAALGGGFLQQGAALAWLSEQQRVANNLFGEQLSVQQADSPRGALASAMGVSMSGHRSTVFLSAPELSACQDLIQTAAGRHLPLVIHVDNRLSAMHGCSTGSGHDAVHQAMDCGCLVLFASNVQEAVDYTLIARHVAELTLTPALVVIDSAETAMSAQDVRLPSAKLVKQFIGRADELIKSPSNVQKQLFSEQRRRVHNWHDLDKPVLQGALQDPDLFALGSAAKETYFDELVQTTLEQAYAHFAQLTARHYSSVSTYGLKKADIIVIAQGSAIETLTTFSHYLKSLKKKNSAGIDKINLGVIGLHCLRPFDSSALLDLITENTNTKQPLIVLERLNTSLADDAPLMREIRAALQKSATASATQVQKLRSVIYGQGGSVLNISDLWMLISSVNKNSTNGKYLGIPFISYDVANARSKTKEYHPKRQVMLDTLERYYPHITELGINASANKQKTKQFALCSPATESLSFAVSYNAENSLVSYAMDLSSYLYKLKNGFIRSTISSSWEQWSQRRTDFITQSDIAYATGSSSLVDFFMLLDTDEKSLLSACQKLNDNGVLFFSEWFADIDLLSTNLSPAVINEITTLINEKNLTLYKIDEQTVWENMLATMTAVLLNNQQVKLKSRKIISIRESLLNDSDDDASETTAAFKDTLNAAMEELQPYQAEKQFSRLSRNMADTANEAMFSDVPEMVKNLGQGSETYDSLPRFWDQVGVLQQQGESDQLTADPYLATGTIPSLSATFNNMRQYAAAPMPEFNPQFCTACGDCWANCPESAIAVTAITPKALIETGIKLSGADALRSVSSKLASQIAKRCRNNEVVANNSGDLLTDAFNWFKEKAGMPQERMQSIEADFDKAHAAIAALSVVASDLLFYSQEKKQNDSGELLSLVINPDSCKSCGLCVELCSTRSVAKNNEDSLALSTPVLTEQTGEAESESRQKSEKSIAQSYKKQWQIWQKTPDTDSATIERLLHEQTMDAGSALMLSRHNAFALSGGDHGESGSGEKIAMRQLLSAAEYHQQPLLHQFITELDRLRDALKNEINNSLSEALPTDNLMHLADKLSDVKTRQVDLNTLLEQNKQVMDTASIDAMRTHQLVTLVLQMNELHWKLSEGAYGIGRARYSLCITSSSIASWAGTFPNNPFHVPVNIDVTGESAQLAAGLVQGQINDLLSAVSLMRKAKAAIDARYAKATEKLEHLNWQDLTREEQQLCPPLFLVGGDDLLGAHGFSQIALLLNSSYPIKVVIFNELDAGLASDGLQEYHLNRRQDSPNNLAMMAMSQQNAYVAQTSIADNNHFQQSVEQLLSNTCAGLISVHTPSPKRHGFKAEETVKQAELAVYSGMFPLYQYNPQDEGVFGSRLTLHECVAQETETELNPVHWALNESRFQAHFTELAGSAVQPVELSDWLQLSTADKDKKTPYMLDEQENKIAISKDFASIVAASKSTQRTLQELAGIVTPFTDYVEHCVAERLSSEHQAELEALRVEYEAKVKQLEENYNHQTHAKIRNQLLGLAGYDANKLN